MTQLQEPIVTILLFSRQSSYDKINNSDTGFEMEIKNVLFCDQYSQDTETTHILDQYARVVIMMMGLLQ